MLWLKQLWLYLYSYFEFPEQAIGLAGSAAEISSLTGEFSLEFNGAATPLVPANVSAAALTAALMRLETVGEVEQRGQSAVLGSAPARPLSLIRPRLAALRGSALPE